MVAGGSATAGEAVEGETHVGGGVGTEGQQFTHGTGGDGSAAVAEQLVPEAVPGEEGAVHPLPAAEIADKFNNRQGP